MSEKTFEFLYTLDTDIKIKANSEKEAHEKLTDKELIDGISRSSNGIDGDTIVVIDTKILD